MHYTTYLTSANNQAFKPPKIIQKKNRIDMEKKVKILLKEVRKDANKAMRYMLESGQPPRNIKHVYQIMVYHSTREECWKNPTEFGGKMYSNFHESTNSEHAGFWAEKLVAAMDRFGLEIEPFKEGNLKHAMWIYLNWGLSGFYKTLYRHVMKTLHCSYCVRGALKPETDISLQWHNSQWPKNMGYIQFCKEKFKDGIPTIEEMQQSVHLCEMSSAARHAEQYGMKKEEVIHFATEAFNMADWRHQNICGLVASANTNCAYFLPTKRKVLMMMEVVK